MKRQIAMDERSFQERLMARARAGAPLEEEFRQLFDRYHRAVYAFFANRGFSREESLDLTQETFLRVYKGIEGFRGDVELKRWLLRIAANLWKNELRRRSAEKREALEVPLERMAGHAAPSVEPARVLPAASPGPLEDVLSAERIQAVRRLLRQLPPQMRRCMLLRIDGELKYREIAEVMQLSIDTVKSQLGQARERLRSELDRRFAAPGP